MVFSFLRIENPKQVPDLRIIQKEIKPSTGFSYVFKISPKNAVVKIFAEDGPSAIPGKLGFTSDFLQKVCREERKRDVLSKHR